MTTTVTSPQDADAYAGSANRSRRPWGLIALAAAVVVVGGGAGAWALLGMARDAKAADTVDRFTVTPRSFAVVLREKGELKAAKSTDIKCEVEGRSTIISLIPEGSVVEEGDLLVELASDQIEDRIQSEELRESNAEMAFNSAKNELDIQLDRNESDIRKADLQIELRQLALDKYTEGDRPQTEKDHEIAIEEAIMTLDRSTEDLKDYRALREDKYVTQTDLEKMEFAFKKAEWDLVKANLAMEVLRRYTHQADEKQKQSDLDEAKKEAGRIRKNAAAEADKKSATLDAKQRELALTREKLDKLRGQKEKCRITAPAQGFVVYFGGGGGRHGMSSASQIKEGASVHQRQVLMSLPDTTEMLVVVRVHEAKMDKVKLGQPVTVKVEGLPGKQFPGAVTKIAMLADTANRWINPDLKEYETEITLDPTEATLKPGTTAHVTIHVDAAEDVLAVPVQAIFTKGRKRYVFRDHHAKVEPVEIKIGATSIEWAEVTEGLAKGDQILLAVSEDLQRDLPDPPEPTGHAGMMGMNGMRQPMQGRGSPGGGGMDPRAGRGERMGRGEWSGQGERGGRGERAGRGGRQAHGEEAAGGDGAGERQGQQMRRGGREGRDGRANRGERGRPGGRREADAGGDDAPKGDGK